MYPRLDDRDEVPDAVEAILWRYTLQSLSQTVEQAHGSQKTQLVGGR